MRVVLVGNFSVSYSSESHHAKSLEALGHEVIRLQETEVTTERILAESLQADLLVWIHTHGWALPGFMSISQVLNSCRDKGIPSVAYHLDLYKGIPSRFAEYKNDPYMQSLDHFFTADGPLADWLNESTPVRGHYLPPGVFHEEAYLQEDCSLDYDVIFVGSYGYHPEWPYRPKLIDWLMDTYQERFTLFGGNKPGQVAHVVRGAPLNRLYASSKVVVGDTFCPGFNYGPYFSDRIPETLGRGGMLIHPRAPGVEDDFDDGQHLVLYDYEDFTGLKESIDYYLNHGPEREKIRQQGNQHVKENHTYLVRWQHILEAIKK